MSVFKIFDNKQLLLDAELNQSIIITGGSLNRKHHIYQLIKRHSDSSRYSEVEKGYYGNEGIRITLGEAPIKTSTAKIFCIESIRDLLDLLSLKKGGLLELNIDLFLENTAIMAQFYKIEDELFILENHINHFLSQFTSNLSLTTRPIDYKKWLLKELDINFKNHSESIPEYLIDPEVLLQETIELLIPILTKTTKKYFLVFHNPEALFNEKKFMTLYKQLNSIATSNNNFKIIIIHGSSCFNYGISEVEKIVIPTKYSDQLPDFNVLKDSIRRHYPQNRIPNDELLVASLYRIINFAANPKGNFSISPKDMVLLKVINNLIDISTDFSYHGQEISDLEAAFLKIDDDF